MGSQERAVSTRGDTASGFFDRLDAPHLCAALREFATAQGELAQRAKEDSAYWHHVALANLLHAAACHLNGCDIQRRELATERVR